MEWFIEKKIYLSKELCQTFEQIGYIAKNTLGLNSHIYSNIPRLVIDVELPMINISKREWQRFVELLKNMEKETDKYRICSIYIIDFNIVKRVYKYNEQNLLPCCVYVQIFDDMDKEEIETFKTNVHDGVIKKIGSFIKSLNNN